MRAIFTKMGKLKKQMWKNAREAANAAKSPKFNNFVQNPRHY